MSRLKKWGRRLGIGILGLLALGLVLWTAGELWTRPMLEEALAESAELGSLDFRSLLPAAPPAGDNGIWDLQRAAALIEQARKDFPSPPGVTNSFPFFPHRPDPRDPENLEARAYLRKVLEARPETLAAARKAADAPVVHQVLDPGNQPLVNLLLPHLSQHRSCGQLLETAARLASEDGRTAEALADAVRIPRLARSLEREPILISALVAVALRGSAFRAADAALAGGADADPEVLDRLSRALEMDPDLFRRTLAAERAFGLDLFQHLINGGFSEELSLDGPDLRTCSVLPARPWLRWETVQYLRYMNAAVRDSGAEGLLNLPEPRGYLCGMLVPAFENAEKSLRRTRAQSEGLRAALAVRKACAESGRLPAALPAGFTDPYTGTPFVYRPEPDGSGFLLYSVGENGKDDGGDLVTPQNASQPPDLGVRWKVPASK